METGLWKQFDRIVVFDTETTGIEFGRDEIIELGAAAFSAEGETDCMDLLLRLSPGRTLPPFITQLTGITEEQLEQEGVEVTFLRADARGCIDYADLPRALRPNTRAIVCTHASNLTGNALDASRIGAFAREHGLLFILDASQTAGSFDLNAQRDGVSVLCFTGHKGMMGPQGTGGLIAAPGVEIRPLKTGGTGVQSYRREQPEEYPTRLESGTLNGHGIAGLSAAVDFLNEVTPAAIHAHETALMSAFYNKVSALPGVTVYGDFTQDRAPIVTLNIGDMDSGEAAEILSDEYGIAVRSGAHCAPRMHEALGTVSQGAVRFSFGWFNTMEEAEQAADAVRDIAL